MAAKLLNKIDYELFQKQFPDMDAKKMEKMEKNILFLYEDSVEIVKRLIERGFTEDYKNINAKEWILFVTKVIPKIESIKNVKIGKDKIELLMGFIFFIIINALPISPEEKEILIVIVKEFLPDIVDAIIFTSKKIHTFFAWLKKKICC